MIEKEKDGTQGGADTEFLGQLLTGLSTGHETPEGALRKVWQRSYREGIFTGRRQSLLISLVERLNSADRQFLEEIVGQNGATRMMRIAAEESKINQERLRSKPQKSSRGMAKHIRREKAKERR